MTTAPGTPPRLPPAEPGLRERKKQQMRWTIQSHAIRLFLEQGYEATTVDRICQEADVSPSTFFRYFPTKEDVIVQDQYDPFLVEIFREASLAPDPVRTLASRLRETIGRSDLAERRTILVRSRLALSEPAVRARLMDHLLGTVQMLADTAGPRQAGQEASSGRPGPDRPVRGPDPVPGAQQPPAQDGPGPVDRTGRSPLSPARLFVGACVGAWIAAWEVLRDADPSPEDLLEFLVEPLSAVRFPGRDPGSGS